MLMSIDVDNAVAAQNDPTGGRGVNGSITKVLKEDGEKKEEEEVMRSAV
jgi:hypothetical protein